MQRIMIAVDLENNEVFDEEVKKAIMGVGKQAAREVFEKSFTEEMQRIVDDRISQWTSEPKTSCGPGQNLHKEFTKKIDEKLNKALGDTPIDSFSINRAVKDKLNDLDVRIDGAIASAVNEDKVTSYLSKLVKENIEAMLSSQILNILLNNRREEK